MPCRRASGFLRSRRRRSTMHCWSCWPDRAHVSPPTCTSPCRAVRTRCCGSCGAGTRARRTGSASSKSRNAWGLWVSAPTSSSASPGRERRSSRKPVRWSRSSRTPICTCSRTRFALAPRQRPCRIEFRATSPRPAPGYSGKWRWTRRSATPGTGPGPLPISSWKARPHASRASPGTICGPASTGTPAREIASAPSWSCATDNWSPP